ncbi:MAG: alpha-ketoacid dehydrogenase subunit beta [Thaumarchaeota archaeon]|nr:alpha-ketoacid dehydrogenase subunit beta [Nitrososphaerota archaeon]
MPSLTLVQAINTALREEMQRDEHVLVLGEDIGKNGGVFRATEGLYNEFGGNRVIDTPLNESSIVGVSIGLSLYGFKPIAEIQFLDFIYPAFDQIASELSKLRYRSGGEYKAPIVIRSPYGGGAKGGPYHSQSLETFFTHIPGLKVIIPSNPYDAKGLLKAAVREDDPIVFLEPKRLYRSTKSEVPDEDYIVPIGKARVAREGKDVSVFAYGAVIPTVLEASEKAQQEGISTEIVDLRTLVPLDLEAVLASVKKTGRAVIVYEAPKFMGYGAEIAALIAEEALEYLEAPIARVGGFDTPYPYAHENLYMPTPTRILNAIKKVAKY